MNAKAFTLKQYVVLPGSVSASRVRNKIGVQYRKTGLEVEWE